MTSSLSSGLQHGGGLGHPLGVVTEDRRDVGPGGHGRIEDGVVEAAAPDQEVDDVANRKGCRWWSVKTCLGPGDGR